MSFPHNIPTPPSSPFDPLPPPNNLNDSLKATLSLLDSLVAFYQHERMWVYRTRAVLDEAFEALPTVSSPDSDSLKSECSDEITIPPPTSDSSFDVVKPNVRPRLSKSSPSEELSSRWMRRKRGFKLRLEGISKRRRPYRPLRRDQEDRNAKEHILQLFEKMMEGRVESCQRVNKLVRSAGCGDLTPSS